MSDPPSKQDRPQGQPLDYSAPSAGRGCLRIVVVICMVLGGIFLLMLGICAVVAVVSNVHR